MIENNKVPKIFVILLSYNSAKYLGQAIESCLAQTFTDFDLIVIDDCSKDNSLEVTKYYAKEDSCIQVIQNKVNKNYQQL